LKVVRLIGSSNHLCELLYRKNIEEDTLSMSQLLPFEEAFSKAYFEYIFYQNHLLNYDQKITRLDLPYVYKMKFKYFSDLDQEIKADYRACIGHQCPHKDNCSYFTGLKLAKDANVIIGNHSLSFTWPKAVTRPNFTVVDEAHKIEGEVTSTYTLEFSQNMFLQFQKQLMQMQAMNALFYLLGFEEQSEKVIDGLREHAQSVHSILSDHANPLTEMIELFFKKQPKYSAIYWNEKPMLDETRLADELSAGILNSFKSIHFVLEEFYQKLLTHISRFDVKTFNNEQKSVAYSRFEAFFALLEDLYLALDHGVKKTTRSLC
jgi:ATP-dependent DNA helicase DinG